MHIRPHHTTADLVPVLGGLVLVSIGLAIPPVSFADIVALGGLVLAATLLEHRLAPAMIRQEVTLGKGRYGQS